MPEINHNIKLSKFEQETILNYNQEESFASVYTHNKALMNKLDKAIGIRPEISVEKDYGYCKEYHIPKKWIKVKIPPSLSEEKREKLKETAIRNLRGGGESESKRAGT